MTDSFLQAFRELKADRFRTLLSLLGVAVGIFSIVAALTLVDSLQASVREGFAAYGSDILFVDREPLEPDLDEDGSFRWWMYAGRPAVSWQDYRFLKEKGQQAYQQIAFVSYGIHTVGVAGDWRLLVPQTIVQGRGFTPGELAEGAAVTVVGAEAEANLGEKIWLDGQRYEVIGIFGKAGLTTVSPVDIDALRLIPARGQQGPVIRGSILLSAADREAIRSLMRTARRLTPLDPDNFALNKLSFLMEEMNSLFTLAAKLGWIIGLFALLSGGFGIANMMYVSVEERRPQIGIRRALGAKRETIIRTFLEESVTLSLLGSILGIGLTALLFEILNLTLKNGISFGLTPRAACTGLIIALTVGLIFGLAPARAAAKLSPVEAMNSYKK